MKIYRLIIIFFVLAVACLLIWQNSEQAEKASLPSRETKSLISFPRVTKLDQRSIKEIIENMRLTRKRSLDQEATRLVQEVRKKTRDRDTMGFHSAMDAILHRYEGDPNPLILEIIELLNHEDPQIRIYMADVLLLTNMETELAKRTLQEIVLSPTAFMSKEDKEEQKIIGAEESRPEDLRILAANVIAKYGIKEASDNVWILYQNTKNHNLVRPLRRLGEPRIINELKTEAVKHLMSIENMKIIGEYRYEEALPELQRRYADKNLSADMRFRTLFPLWRITGDEKYFDEFALSFLPSTIPAKYLAVGNEKERQYLIGMLKTSKSNTLQKAAMALHLRYHDNEPIKKMLIGYYEDPSGSNWSDPVLARRLVGSINDDNLTNIAKGYESRYPTGYFNRDVIYKNKWRYPEWEEPLFMD
jgi:hypothetical protein